MVDRPTQPPEPTQPSFFGSIWRGTKATARAPFTTFPIEQILENARLIRTLAGRLGAAGEPEPRVFRRDDGRLDLAATSFRFGVSSHAMLTRLAARRRQTARLAYGSLILGCIFVALWLWHGLTSGPGGLHILGAVQFIPFCAIFFLVAFKNAHLNWQLRTGQFGSAGEYLRSPEPFWPS